MQEYTFTISEYLDVVNSTLQSHRFTLVGEITSFNMRGGAVFFTIADTEEEAVLECVIWTSVFSGLGIELEEGMEVKISGSASVYKKNGRFRFVAYDIVPIGEGALKKAFERLKQRLQEQGYFDPARKRALPPFIKKIGLITAEGSDAKKDFETHIGNYGYKVFFHDVKVEGTNAIKEIVNAFDWFNESPLDLDVLVLTRGGGSLESLMAFNSEDVAKAIYKSRIPVISAVGHENDVSIADLVADMRCSTPTHAGRTISMPYQEVTMVLQNYTTEIFREYKSWMDQQNTQLSGIGDYIIGFFTQHLDRLKMKVQKHENVQLMALRGVFDKFRTLENKILVASNKMESNINQCKSFIGFSEKLLAANDPKHKLKQGYSITTLSDGKVLKNTESIKEGDILITRFFSGKATSKVQNKQD